MIRTVALFGKVKNPPKYTISPQLSKILNSEVITRPEALKQMWVYIKAHNLQDPKAQAAAIDGVFSKSGSHCFHYFVNLLLCSVI